MQRVAAPIAFYLVASSVAAADLDAAIEDCNGCHGDDGVSQWSDVPTIAGIDAFVHSEALYVYRDEARPCAASEYRQGDTSRPATTMCDIVADFDDATIEALAEHYAALPFLPAKQDFDPARAAAGELIHERDCGRCHTDGGSNPDDAASILAGQWMGYLERTFEDYAAGERDQPAAMKKNIDALSSDDIQALLHFYASRQ